MNEKALYKLTYGLYIISSEDNGKVSGCVANTLQQVTSSPMQLAITLNKNNYTEQLIEKSGKFNGVVLTQNVDMDTIRRFGFQSGKDVNKYDGISFSYDALNIPYIKDHVAARFSCKVVSKLDLGTHVLFVGEVVDCDVVNDEEVMTYAYYHQVKNGATPKNAPSFQEEKTSGGWRCTICGYIYEHDVLPDDFVCPWCKAPKDVFEKIA